MNISTDTILNVAKAITPLAEGVEFHGDYTVIVPKEHIIDVLAEFKENPALRFDRLSDITAIDWANKREDFRFDVVYILYSMTNKQHLRVKAGVRENAPHIPTAVDVWEAANWYERETYDMYGIIFDGHPDLRRFYMPEDFMDDQGEQLYPLRKDFPLMGIPGSLPLPPK